MNVLAAHRPSREGYVLQKPHSTLMMAPPPRRGRGECAVPPLEIGIQAIQLSPYRAGLAGRHPTRLPMAPASPTCSCPLQLSPSGKSDDPEASLRTSPNCVRDSAPRPAAHAFIAHGSREKDVYRKFLFRQLHGVHRGQLARSLTTFVPFSLPSPSGPSPCM